MIKSKNDLYGVSTVLIAHDVFAKLQVKISPTREYPMLRNVKIPNLLKYCYEYELKHYPFLTEGLDTKKPSAERKGYLQQFEPGTLRLVNMSIREYRDCTPLHLAVHLGDVEATKYLLAHKAIAIINQDGKYAHQIELDRSRANQPEYVAKYNEARNLVIGNSSYRQSLKRNQTEMRRLDRLWVAEQQQIAKRKAAIEQQHQRENQRRYAEGMARATEGIRAAEQNSLNDLIKRHEIERREYEKKLDKMGNINQPPQVQPTKSVAFQNPLYSLQDCHRSGGMPIQKTASIFLAEESSAAKRFNEQRFQGYGGMQCDVQAILRGESAMNILKEEKFSTGAKITNGMHTDVEWGCALEHIQPSPLPKLK